MATQKPSKFDEVDWDAEDERSGGPNLSINTKLFLITAAPIAVLAVYDWQFVDERTPSLNAIGEAVGSQYIAGVDFAMLDYVFYVTLLMFVFYLALPLYQNPRMTRYYWNEFKRNRPAVISLIWLGIVFVGGLLGPLFVSAPSQQLEIAYQPPVFWEVNEVYLRDECVGTIEDGYCQGTWEHPFGTTGGGRDVFDMIIYGMTITMQIGFIATFIAVSIGTLFGTVSAYAGGWVDEILMRYVDIQQSFPTLILFILILYTFGGGLALFILLFGLFSWGGMARYVRSKALSVSEEEYIKATKVSGASTARVIRRHVVPNSASSIITDITLLIPGFLLAEAQLAFLGLGDASVSSWGQLISTGRSDLEFAPWIVLAPGMVLFLTILAFNFLGDALLDALNPEAEAESEK